MIRKLGESKSVTKYLKGRYKKIYKTNFDENVVLQKKIILDHDKEELNRMLKRVKAAIEVEKDTQALNSQPFSIILVMITVMTSAGMAMITSFMSFISIIFGKYLDSKDVKEINFNDLFNSLTDFTPVIKYVLLISGLPFMILIVYWCFTYKRNRILINRLYKILVLLEECLEDYDKVVKKRI